MKLKIKIAALALIFVCAFSVFGFFVSAEEKEASKLDINMSPSSMKLFDGDFLSYEKLSGKYSLELKDEARYIYIIFLKNAASFKISGNEIENSFLHCLVDLKEIPLNDLKNINLEFESNTEVSEISAFSDGVLPSDVEDWSKPCEKADLLLVSTHSDDEQLFFAGLLPLYAGERKYNVQVAYFINHNVNFKRNHELLSGLWTVGVRNYPEISAFPDAWADDKDHALKNLAKAGFSYADAVEYQTYLIRKYKPLVAVGHDFAGEYGHGQHILNAATLTEAVMNSGNDSFCPDIAEAYGVHTVKKYYVHLYNENQISLNIDEPLESFGGKSAFNVTQEGFEKHKSQHNTWFKAWLNGADGKNTKASSIKKYSPCLYGLYKSEVGEDVLKNDMFENIVTYKEQDELEAKRLEEEKRAEEQRKAEIKEKQEKTEKTDKKSNKRIALYLVFAAVLTNVILFVTVFAVKKKKI